MRFDRLRLTGFKSFVDPTELVIREGLTGVVGPNGCGKSNLLEALRWVMGENRPSAMRGGGMEDVIFNGAATRGARHFAEVALVMDNQDRLWDALRDGTIDCIVSDHSPSTAELKQMEIGDFATAWGGVSSIQVAFTAVWTAARARGFELTDVVRWMCERPADIVRMQGKGAIALGHSADLIAYAPDERWTVDVNELEHRNKISAYDGLELTGVVRRTFLRGVEVDLDTTRGSFLTRN